MSSRLVFAALIRSAFASLTIDDPSNVISPSDWEADNAIVADYNVPFPESQPSDIEAAYSFTSGSKILARGTYSVDKNDTSVILVTDGASLTASHVTILKEGYSSNLDDASFWGFNAAVNVANASSAHFEHVNITVHNGAANVYSYGSDTTVKIENSWLYSSGPVSHGLYASGNGTIIGRNIEHYSGGRRSSAFSGDSPAGYIEVYDSVSHCANIGSATFYALGEIFAENVLSRSEKGPVVFMDADQKVTLVNCDATAGLLGGVAIFSSSERESGASVNFNNSKITTVGDIPGLWFGNVIADVSIINSRVEHDSGVLVVANYSQITQDFDHYADYSDNNNLLPAEVTIDVKESSLDGNLVAYNGSYISFSLSSYSSWKGAAYSGYKEAYFDVALDKTSNWTLTTTTTVQNLTDSDKTLSNIFSGGHTLYYNSSASLSKWLEGKTVKLSGGGTARPIRTKSARFADKY